MIYTQHEPADFLARHYVRTRAMKSRELVRRFDSMTGARLGAHFDELPALCQNAKHPIASDLARFGAFAEAALWDRAPSSVRADVERVIRVAVCGTAGLGRAA